MTRDHIIPHIGRTLAATLIVVMLATLGSCTPAGGGDVIATVDGQPITSADLLREMHLRHGPSMLVEMIDEILIHQAGAAAGISVTEEELQLRWDRAIAEAGSEMDLEAILLQRDLSQERFREQLRTDLLLDKLVRAAMVIDEQEIEDFYHEYQDDYRRGERVKARMILVATEDNAVTIAEALEAGGDFAGLATALSIDPASKEEGGEMGWFERQDYAEVISTRAFEMQPGETSEPFEAPDGWVILHVEGRDEAGLRPLEEVHSEVRGRIMRAKVPLARGEWITAARTEAALRITDSELREATLSLLEDAPPPGPVTLMPAPQVID